MILLSTASFQAKFLSKCYRKIFLSSKVLCVHFPINSKSSFFFFIPLDVTIAVTRLLPPMRIDIKAVCLQGFTLTGEPFQI